MSNHCYVSNIKECLHQSNCGWCISIHNNTCGTYNPCDNTTSTINGLICSEFLLSENVLTCEEFHLGQLVIIVFLSIIGITLFGAILWCIVGCLRKRYCDYERF
jgi:hypothetical protein